VPEVSILIVTYRARALLEGCLASLEAYAPRGVETIVVDNDSRDGTLETLPARFPAVRWVGNDDDVGFAPAVNQAAALAAGRHLLVFASDAVLLPGAVERLVAFLDARPRAALVGPRLLLSNGEPYVSAVRFPTLGSVLLYETRLNRLLPRARRPYAAELAAGAAFAVDAVEGSVFLARREAWEAVGGFDDRYFFGFEDMDLGWRLRRAGWQTWHDPAPAAVHHHAGASGGTRSASTLLLVSVGLGAMYFMRKNRPASYAALWPPLVAAFSVKWALTRLLGRRAHATAFRETVRAMLGLRPMWIVPEDRRRWT